VVDDERPIAELLSFNLTKAGYDVVCAYDGPEAVRQAVREKPDLIVLDIMLPQMDGFEVCRELRLEETTAGIPLLFLSARREEIDRIVGLELGADDYVTKPFSPRELLARVKAILRRTGPRNGDSHSALITSGDLRIDQNKHVVTVRGENVDLTAKEFELLKLLAVNAGKVFSREELLEKLWDYEYFGDTRTVDVHIRHLREKIEANPGTPEYVLTVRGVGYKFREK